MSKPNEMIDKLLSSEAKGELLILFHKNPGLIDTLDGVARRIGRNGSVIEKDVKDLMDLGLLRSRRIGKFQVISLNRARDMEIQNIISDYIMKMK
jgi:predicted transcriptional regulator